VGGVPAIITPIAGEAEGWCSLTSGTPPLPGHCYYTPSVKKKNLGHFWAKKIGEILELKKNLL